MNNAARESVRLQAWGSAEQAPAGLFSVALEAS